MYNFGLSECNRVHVKEKKNTLNCVHCLPFCFSDEQFDQNGEKKFRVGGKKLG